MIQADLWTPRRHFVTGNSRKAAPTVFFRTRNRLYDIEILAFSGYFFNVSHLTRQEQLVLCIIISLFLTGWIVKAYRTGHPPVSSSAPAKN